MIDMIMNMIIYKCLKFVVKFWKKIWKETFNSLLLNFVLNLFKIFSCFYIYSFIFFIEFQSNDMTSKCFQAACNAFVSFCLTLTITFTAIYYYSPIVFYNFITWAFLYNLSAKSIKSNLHSASEKIFFATTNMFNNIDTVHSLHTCNFR